MKLPVPRGPEPIDDYFAYAGGLDLVTPEMEKKPGRAIRCLNWDIPSTGGYRTHPGYERYDGRPRPSLASVTQLQSSTPFAGTLAVGDTLNGQTSGSTGLVIYISTDRTWLALTKVSAAFTIGENLREGVTVVGVNVAFATAISAALGNTLLALAAQSYRLDIGVVPGSGPVRGVWEYNDTVYAFRDNAGGTACIPHRATTGGWTAITLAEELTFTAGNSSVEVGDTLTQGGVTATIRRVIIISGTSPTLVGKLVITGRSGGNFAAGAATSTGGGSLTLGGAQAAQSFPPGGKYGFENTNFGGSAATKRMYGWNGVGRAFEFDGTYFAFIDTGMNPDTPSFGAIHLTALWLAFGSSLQKSAAANPFAHSAVLGAAELAAGDTITGLLRVPGSENTASLMVFTKNFTRVVYGKTLADLSFPIVMPEVGARSYTALNVTQPVFLDDLGITSATAGQEFGNFNDADLSADLKPYLEGRIDQAVCSVIIRKDGQYKLFFNDGAGITATFRNRRMVGMLPFQLAHVMNVACESEKDGGIVLCGSTDGYVYELGRGRSFDGGAIDHSLRMAFNFVRSPRRRKRFRRVRLDVQAPGYHTLNVGYIAGRNDPEIDSGSAGRTGEVTGGAGGFDDATAGFDEIAFDGDIYTYLALPIDVTATDLSLIFSGSSNEQLPITLTGQSMAITMRREQRQ